MHYTIDYFRYVYGLKKTFMNQPDYLFLIGGADLEMSTIKQLLIANGFTEGKNMADHHLAWGAKLSDYQNLFNETQTFVGIELVNDITPPLHYINNRNKFPITNKLNIWKNQKKSPI